MDGKTEAQDEGATVPLLSGKASQEGQGGTGVVGDGGSMQVERTQPWRKTYNVEPSPVAARLGAQIWDLPRGWALVCD